MRSKTHLLALILLLSFQNASALAADGVRVIQFPGKQSYGAFCEVKKPDQKLKDKYPDQDKGRPISIAQGRVILKASPGMAILFEPSREAFLHPEVLDNIPPDVVSNLRIKFTAMDTSEEKLCDGLLPHIGRLKKLRALILKSSDTSDSGFESITPLPDLVWIELPNTMVTAKCLPTLAKYSALQKVVLSNDTMSGADLTKLSPLKKLNNLALHNSSISDADLAGLTSLPSITWLEIPYNRKLTGKCLAYVKTLKSLRYLDVSNTGIKPHDLLQLRDLPLERLICDQHSLDKTGLEELQKAFPNTLLSTSAFGPAKIDITKKGHHSKKVTPFEKVIFAPLH